MFEMWAGTGIRQEPPSAVAEWSAMSFPMLGWRVQRLGLGIGRLVFRALAVAFTLALVLAIGTVTVGAATWALTALLWAVLAAGQVFSGPDWITVPASSWPGRVTEPITSRHARLSLMPCSDVRHHVVRLGSPP
jgi:hypothetical protein